MQDEILEVIPALNSGGAECFVVDLCNQMAIDGHEVTLLTMKDFSLKNKQRPYHFSYILVYDLNHISKEMAVFIKRHSQQNGWKIVAVNDKVQTLYADKNVNNAGPIEFLNLIANAELVVADSFHATALSIIFHRPFACFYKKTNISRMKDLLTIAGLSDRLNPTAEPKDIDWQVVQERIDAAVIKSKEFLSQQIRLSQ